MSNWKKIGIIFKNKKILEEINKITLTTRIKAEIERQAFTDDLGRLHPKAASHNRC